MRQTLTLEKLKALRPCSDKYLNMFGEHTNMNIEQAFDAGFTIPNICWLMGVLNKRKEIIEFANFCAKQVDDDAIGNAAHWAACAADKNSSWVTTIHYAAYCASRAADAAARADKANGASILKEQEKFLMELLK